MTHSKSQIVEQVAETLGLPVVDIKSSVDRQVDGLPIVERNIDTKVEYHLKTSLGKLVATFDDQERAQKWVMARAKTHKHKVATVNLFKVTTISEQL